MNSFNVSMKSVFVFLFLIVLASTNEEEAIEAIQKCTDETHLTESDVKELLLADDDESDAKAEKFVMCFFKKSHIIDDAGKLDEEAGKAMIKTFLAKIDAADDQEALDCIQEKETVQETVISIAKCVEKRKAELTNSK